MNTGFDPVVVAPGLFKTQTASQQMPFRFGGSQVPIHLAMRGSGMGERPVMSIRPVRRPPKMSGSGASASVGDGEITILKGKIEIIMRYLLDKSKREGGDNMRKFSLIQDQYTGVMRLMNVPKERKKQLLREVLDYAESISGM